MIRLASNHLLFQTADGESYPISPETISVELVGESVGAVDPEIVHNAAAAVVHYYKHDLHREVVSAGEFARTLQKVLHGFGFTIQAIDDPAGRPEADLDHIARETGGELVFFPRLRHALRHQLAQPAPTLHFHGLRGCVKQLAGARRWSPRCDALRDQIVDFLRQCLNAEPDPAGRTLVVR